MRIPERGRRRWRGGRTGTFICVLLGLCLAVAPVVGQDMTGNAMSLQRAAPSYRLPSEKKAFTWSLIGGLAPIGGMALLAIIQASDWDFGIPVLYIPLGLALAAGPSAGFFYGGCWGRGLLTTGLRLCAIVLDVAYYTYYDEAGPGINYACLAGIVGSYIFDLATVKKTVRKHNQARLARRGLSVALSPIALPRGAGLQLQMSF